MTRRPEHIAPHADPVDVHVGARIRAGRKALGMSQEQLAGMISVTFQQLQKYESGVNRISGSRLYKVACALRAPVEAFYEGLPSPVAVGVAPLPAPSNLLLEDALEAVPEIAGIGRMPAHMRRSLRQVICTMLDALPAAA